MLQLPLDIQLNDSAKFNNYFVGENGQLFDKLRTLDSTTDSFIFVWGAQGVGKSHLAQAACHSLVSSEKIIAYFPVGDLGVHSESLENLEHVDFVCIDGFESVAGSQKWETAFFNLFNQLRLHNHQLVIFSQLSPSQLSISLADLKSRLGSMEIYKLKAISDRQKTDFLIDYGKSRGLDIAQDVASFILTRTNREVKSIQLIVKKLDQQALTHKRRITVPFVKNILDI